MLRVNAKDGVCFSGIALKQVLEELSDGAAAAGIDEGGRDFRQGHEDEGALGEAGMGQLQAGLAEAEVAEEKQIEIEGAGAVGQAARAVAAVPGLDGEQAHEQSARGKAGLQGDDGVDEAGLVRDADRRGGVKRRPGADLPERGERVERGGEGGLRSAAGAGKVGAEADVCGAHSSQSNPAGREDESGRRRVSGSIHFGDDLRMDGMNNAVLGVRRNEDIALDLLKFVAGMTGVGKPTAPSTGFSGTPATKPEEHVSELLALYGRCLKAVKGEGA